MEIIILGTTCANCSKLVEITKQAISELNIKASVIKEEDMAVIMKYNVAMLPCIVINKEIVSEGKLLSLGEIKTLLMRNI